MSNQVDLSVQSRLPAEKKRRVLGDIKNIHTLTTFAKPMPRKSLPPVMTTKPLPSEVPKTKSQTASMHSNDISNISPRRTSMRPSEIAKTTSPRRRLSQIPEPTASPRRTRPSKIPEPSSSSSSSLDKVASETNRRTSQIPRPPHSKQDEPLTRSTELQSKLALLKSNLERKSRINTSRPTEGRRYTLQTQSSAATTTTTQDDTAIRITLNKELDTQIKSLKDKVYDLENEGDDLRRLRRKWERKIAEIRADIDISHRKFEFKGEAIMRTVANKELLIDTNLQELSQKLDDEYNETKFQLEEEAKQSAVYKDESLCKEIDELNQRIKHLSQTLDNAKSEKKQEIKNENDLLSKDLNESLESKTEEVEKVAADYDAKNDELEQLLHKVDAIQNSIKLKAQENQTLQDKIDSLQYNAEHFHEFMENLRLELNNAEQELQESTEEDLSWEQQFKKFKGMHEATLEKLKKHITHRQILENSIMNYENKLRVYLRIPGDITISNECEFQVDNRSFQFNKVFDATLPESDLIQEFELLLKSTINNTNVSLVISGDTANTSKPLITQILRTSYELFQSHIQSHTSGTSWDFSFSLQSVTIGDAGCKDAITGDTLAHTDINDVQTSLAQVKTQKLPIEDAESLVRFVQDIDSHGEPTAYWVNIHAKHASPSKSFESRLMLLDISNDSLDRQYDTLSEGPNITGALSKLINYSYCHTKCLHISSLSTIDEISKKVLALFEVINATDSPYRSK